MPGRSCFAKTGWSCQIKNNKIPCSKPGMRDPPRIFGLFKMLIEMLQPFLHELQVSSAGFGNLPTEKIQNINDVLKTIKPRNAPNSQNINGNSLSLLRLSISRLCELNQPPILARIKTISTLILRICAVQKQVGVVFFVLPTIAR